MGAGTSGIKIVSGAQISWQSSVKAPIAAAITNAIAGTTLGMVIVLLFVCCLLV